MMLISRSQDKLDDVARSLGEWRGVGLWLRGVGGDKGSRVGGLPLLIFLVASHGSPPVALEAAG